MSKLLCAALVAAVVLAPATEAKTSSGKVVFTCTDDKNLCAVDGAGHHARKLTHMTGDQQAIEPSLSFDGKRMVFQGTDSQGYTADGNGRHLHAITDGALPVMLPQINAAGTKVLWTESFSAGIDVHVTTFAGKGDQANQIPHGIAGFGPKGQLICDVYDHPERVALVAPGYFFGAGRGACQKDAANDTSDGAVFDWRPQISHNGRLLVGALSHDGITNDSIVLYSVSSTRRLRVLDAHSGDGHPVFSPDGKWVLFDRDEVIYKVSTKGGTAKKFARGSNPTWSR